MQLTGLLAKMGHLLMVNSYELLYCFQIVVKKFFFWSLEATLFSDNNQTSHFKTGVAHADLFKLITRVLKFPWHDMDQLASDDHVKRAIVLLECVY